MASKENSIKDFEQVYLLMMLKSDHYYMKVKIAWRYIYKLCLQRVVDSMVNINISKCEQFSNYNRVTMKWEEKYSPLGAHKRSWRKILCS